MKINNFAIVQSGFSTFVFLDGRCISEGIKDMTYHARDEEGKVKPTLDLKIDLESFSFKEGMTLEEYFKDMKLLEEKLSPEEEIRKTIRAEIDGNVVAECHLEVG